MFMKTKSQFFLLLDGNKSYQIYCKNLWNKFWVGGLLFPSSPLIRRVAEISTVLFLWDYIDLLNSSKIGSKVDYFIEILWPFSLLLIGIQNYAALFIYTYKRNYPTMFNEKRASYSVSEKDPLRILGRNFQKIHFVDRVFPPSSSLMDWFSQ